MSKIQKRRLYGETALEALDIIEFMYVENFYDKTTIEKLQKLVEQCKEYIKNNL